MPPEDQGIKSTRLIKLLKLRVWISELVQPSELQVTLFWAGIIGFTGGAASVLFRKLSNGVHYLFTRQNTGFVESFAHLAWWQRLIIPALGGGLAVFAIYF